MFRDFGKPGLLPRLPQGHGQQVRLPVGVAAGPGPGPVDVVPDHQNPVPCGIHDPCGRREVGDGVLPGEGRFKVLQGIQQPLPVLRFPGVTGRIALDLPAKFLHNAPAFLCMDRVYRKLSLFSIIIREVFP